MSRVLLLAAVFLVCCISKNWALQCYKCDDCENSRVNTENCPYGLMCGRMALDMHIQNQHQTKVIKSCIPEITTGDCKSYITGTLRESGLFTGDAIRALDQLLHIEGVNLQCATCSTDYCNSSSVIYPTMLTFALVLLLLKLW